MKKAKLSVAEIEQYWGSLEAYNEEQRRIGLYELETGQRGSRRNWFKWFGPPSSAAIPAKPTPTIPSYKIMPSGKI